MSKLFFSCGCQYNGQTNENTEKWLSETRCYKCEKASLVDALVLTGELSALVGSEKQIAWANTIRYDTLEQLKKMLGNNTPTKAYNNTITLIKSETSAKIIIDNRDNLILFYKNAALLS